MSDLYLKVDVFGGVGIDAACAQATRVATTLGVVVKFDFNGVPCYARPNSDWRSLARAWGEVFHAGERPPSAMAWSAMPKQAHEKETSAAPVDVTAIDLVIPGKRPRGEYDE